MKYSKRLQRDEDITNLPKYMVGNLITSPFRMADEVVKKVLLFKKKTQLKLLKVGLILTIVILFVYTILATILKVFNVFICTGIMFTVMMYLALMFVVKRATEVTTVYRTGLEEQDSIPNTVQEQEDEEEIKEDSSSTIILEDLDLGESEERKEEIKNASEYAKEKLKNFDIHGLELCRSSKTSTTDLIMASPERAVLEEISAMNNTSGHINNWLESYINA